MGSGAVPGASGSIVDVEREKEAGVRLLRLVMAGDAGREGCLLRERTMEAVREMEAVRVINGPSCPEEGTRDARRSRVDGSHVRFVSWALSGRASGSPLEVVREKGAVMRLFRLVMAGDDGTESSVILWLSGWWRWAAALGLALFTLIPRVDVGLWRSSAFETVVTRLERPLCAFRSGPKPLRSFCSTGGSSIGLSIVSSLAPSSFIF